MKTIVVKFGGASLASTSAFANIAALIRKKRADYERVIVVVSAMGDTTDWLLSLAHKVHPNPHKRELDMLASSGERISMALLAMALERIGLQAMSFTGSQAGVITTSDHSAAKIVDVRPLRLVEALDKGCIPIVAGFQGVSIDKEVTTLGRGGSDTTAVALALALQAERAVFFKDVEGVYDRDPKLYDDARMFPELNYDQALELAEGGAKILHARAIFLASKNHFPLHVESVHHGFKPTNGTRIADGYFCRGTPIYEVERVAQSDCASLSK